MITERLSNEKSLKERTDDFLLRWHKFPIDYWWRKKYRVPFGSEQHRQMDFIDMFIEYREEVNLIKANRKEEVLEEVDNNVVYQSQEEIDDDYDNIELGDG